MRKIFISLIIAIVSLLAGCKPDKCSGYYIDGDCYDCQLRAPISDTVSWTDYNTVNEARTYFYCHKETIMENIGREFNLTGYLYWGGSDSDWVPIYMDEDRVGDLTNWVYLTDNENHADGSKLFSLNLNKEQFDKFMEHREDYFEKKLYVSGILSCLNKGVGGCCSYEPYVVIVDFDTIKTLK